MKFPYSQYVGPNGETIKRPTIAIWLKHSNKIINVEAVIDSGADFNIFPIEIAGYLDIKLANRQKMSFQGAGSNPFTVYQSPSKITHMLRQGGFRPIQWDSTVYFAELQLAILLGNIGFLDQLSVTLNGKKGEITVERA